MTTEELLAREAIRQTMARYNHSGDRLKVDELLPVFTEDAILETAVFRCEGVGEIRDWFTGRKRSDQAAASDRAPRFVRHHLTTSDVEITGPETAKGRTYWIVYTDIGPDHCGYYVDEFRKRGERWLIAHRRVRVDWMAPDSYFDQAAKGASN